MNWFKVKLKSNSYVASAWQSDTIWGHLCWGLRYMHGEDALLEFIDRYHASTPPILLSNGFPDDLLPRPILKQSPLDKTRSLSGQQVEFDTLKEARKIHWLDYGEFIRALKGERFNPVRKSFEERMVTLKNQINRLTATTTSPGESSGQLFSFRQYRWDSVIIYLKIADDFVGRAEELFGYLAQSGYGKRKSAGYGQISLEAFEEFAGFPAPASPNGFITLSNFMPAREDPVKGYWEVVIKYGKLGEEFASYGNPFKKPLVMFAAGSCFYDKACRDYYGRLVGDISPVNTDRVVQYAFSLPVPITLPGKTELSD